MPDYEVEQIVTEYLWVWFAALFMLLLYPIMFLLMRGWIWKKKAVPPNHELHSIGQREDLQRVETERTKKVAQKMLLYVVILISFGSTELNLFKLSAHIHSMRPSKHRFAMDDVQGPPSTDQIHFRGEHAVRALGAF